MRGRRARGSQFCLVSGGELILGNGTLTPRPELALHVPGDLGTRERGWVSTEQFRVGWTADSAAIVTAGRLEQLSGPRMGDIAVECDRSMG